MEEWINVHALRVPGRVKERWFPPVEGWHKINVDGAFRSSTKLGGGGVVTRDHHGSFVAGACHIFPHVAHAEGSKLLACKRGLLVAKEINATKVILETDSTEVAAKIGKVGQDRSIYGSLVNEIKTLLLDFEASSVRAVRRTANEAAHLMAKEGCDSKLCKVWFGVAPENIFRCGSGVPVGVM